MKKISLKDQIKNNILEEIEKKILNPGDKLPSEFELMQKYQVSRITVSNALSELAEQKIVSRYPKKGTFINPILIKSEEEKTQWKDLKEDNLNIQNQTMESKTRKDCLMNCQIKRKEIQKQEKILIGFIIPSIKDLFALNIIHGISSCFYDDSKFYLTITYSGNQNTEEYIIKDMIKKETDGILIFPVDQEIYNAKILEMKVKKYPFVLVDRYLPGLDTHYVISDNVKGGQLATKHLCDLGHKNILVCCGSNENTFSVKERIQGYKEELYRRNLPFCEDNIIANLYTGLLDEEKKREIERKLLDKEITGIITTDSATALFLYDFYKQHQIHIPKDKSLVSYDSPISNHLDFNPFTFIDQNEYQIGKEAGMIMKQLLLQENESEVSIQKVIAPKLVIHNTTAQIKE